MLFVMSQILICLFLALILGALLGLCVRNLMHAFALRSEVELVSKKLTVLPTLARSSDLPDVSGFALRSELPAMLAVSGYALKSEIPAAPDLSGFAHKSEIPNAVDLTAYALKAELPVMPDLSGFAHKTELPAMPDLSGFAHKSEIPSPVDVTPYALKSEIPAMPEMSEFSKKTDLPDISSLATLSQIEQWKQALDDRDKTIASLQRSLTAEAEQRSSEIARLEAIMQGHIAAPVPEAEAEAAPELVKAAKPDDLKRVWGIGPVLETRLHSLGITTFDQIAQWTDADLARIEPLLDTIPDRIQREDWVGQCRTRKFGAPTETYVAVTA